MRIALVNYRFFVAGGPERYMFNIMDLLEKKGHEVIPFSVKNKRNLSTPYEKYFLSAVGKGNEVYFSDVKKNLLDYVKGFGRMVYSFEAKRCFKSFLKTIKPDVIYVLYFQNKISCSIIDAAYEMGIPIVQRISDYSLLAPCDHLYNLKKRCICEKCLRGNFRSAIMNACVYQSKIYSFVKSLALMMQRLRKTSDKVNRYIFPSSFTMNKFIEAGFDAKKLVHIPTLFNSSLIRKDLSIEYQNFALYVGRIDPDKGIETLLDAFIGTKLELRIIGFSSTEGYENLMKQKVEGVSNIKFLGKKNFDEIQEHLSKCLFTIIPSEWYDNLPNALLESYSMGKCVVASNIGSLAENVLDGKTGMLFDYKDSKDLQKKILYLFDQRIVSKTMGINAKKKLEEIYSTKKHIEKLDETLRNCVFNIK